MSFIYSALLEFIIVNYVGRKRPRIFTKAETTKVRLVQNYFHVAPNPTEMLSLKCLVLSHFLTLNFDAML